MQRIRRHLSYANVAATLALVFAMSGGAIAATGGFTSNGKLQGCVNEEGGLKLLKAGKHCRRGQKTLSWNQTGPAGAKGAPGSAGAVGAAGASGQNGQSGAKGADSGTDIKWAAIGPEGTIEGGRGLIESKGVKSPYEPVFDRDITDCSVTATSNSNAIADKITAVHRQKDDPRAVHVYIKNSAETDVSAEYSIVAICPA